MFSSRVLQQQKQFCLKAMETTARLMHDQRLTDEQKIEALRITIDISSGLEELWSSGPVPVRNNPATRSKILKQIRKSKAKRRFRSKYKA
jgi:hypothetical protein